MKIVIDRDLCQGHGVCESEAPDLFVVEKRSTTVTVLEEHPSEAHRAALELAVKYCPTHAIQLIEED